MKSAKQLLIEARSLIAKGWTQGAFARDVNGVACNEADPQACSWCASGAIWLANEMRESAARIVAQDMLVMCHPLSTIYHTVAGLNDHHTASQAEALAWFDAAIERCPE